MFVSRKKYKILQDKYSTLKGESKKGYKEELNKLKIKHKALKEKYDTDAMKVENHKLKLENEKIKREQDHNLKMHEIDLIELKKEASVDDLIKKKQLDASIKEFEEKKKKIIAEAKKEAALEVKAEYVKINEKLLGVLATAHGNKVPKEVLDLLKSK